MLLDEISQNDLLVIALAILYGFIITTRKK
ncbi:hypothetical protein FlaCF_2935 [Flavobacterium tructae]